MKLELADLVTNEKSKLNGFKVLGVFPFYLRYIRADVHIRLCAIKEMMSVLKDGEPESSDFYDSKLQSELIPLLNQYIVTALINKRFMGWFIKILLCRKVEGCGHTHLMNLYLTIRKLDDPAFFLIYWKLIKMPDSTLLKEVEPSLEKSELTKKGLEAQEKK